MGILVGFWKSLAVEQNNYIPHLQQSGFLIHFSTEISDSSSAARAAVLN